MLRPETAAMALSVFIPRSILPMADLTAATAVTAVTLSFWLHRI